MLITVALELNYDGVFGRVQGAALEASMHGPDVADLVQLVGCYRSPVTESVPLLDGQRASLSVEDRRFYLARVQEHDAHEDSEGEQRVLLHLGVASGFEKERSQFVDHPGDTEQPRSANDPVDPRELAEPQLGATVLPDVHVSKLFQW